MPKPEVAESRAESGPTSRRTEPKSDRTPAHLKLDPARPLTSFSLAFALATGAILVIFVVYEVIERVWLSDLDMQALHILHIVRGIVSSLAAAGLVGWVMIARASPPLLVTTPTEEEWMLGQRPSTEQRAAHYARWFISARWIAVAVAAALVVITERLTHLLPEEVWFPLVGTIGVLAVSNIVYSLLLRRDRRGKSLQVQVYGDLVILTILLHFSGGIENPLSLLMIFHVIIGGIILSRAQCFSVALAGIVLFALLAFAEWSELIEHYTLLIFPHHSEGGELHHAAHEPLYVVARVTLNAVVLLLAAYFVTTLADRLRLDERQLEAIARRAIEESQLLHRSLQTTGTALRVVGESGSTRWSNEAWREWFGSDQASPAHAASTDPSDVRASLTFQDGRIRESEHVVPGNQAHEEGAPPASGDQRIVRITTAPLRDPDGHIAEITQLAQDVTYQKRAQKQMIRASQLAAVGQLAGQVAHEVNNPIAIISAKARLLLSDHREQMSQTTADELTRIVHLADRVARIAQGLLSSCRPSAAAKVNLNVLDPLRRALELIAPRAAKSGVTIETHFGNRLPPVLANEAEMEQVILNLLLNALDAMPDGGQLRVSAGIAPASQEGRADELVLTFEDNGIGIPEADRDRIFEPFFTTKESGKGTGLGLSICRGLIQGYGGRIGVSARSPRGTTITIHLPTERTEADRA